MIKNKTIEFVQDTYTRFAEAKNHGNGDNWWYPKANVIAYNVKLHGSSKDVEDIKAKMSDRQNGFYSDDIIYSLIDEERNNKCEDVISQLTDLYDIKGAGFAGRSGGWLEVEYYNLLDDDEKTIFSNIKHYYKLAQNMEKLESEVAEFIENELSDYKQYINSDEYVSDIVASLLDDNEIANIYKKQLANIANKLN